MSFISKAGKGLTGGLGKAGKGLTGGLGDIAKTGTSALQNVLKLPQELLGGLLGELWLWIAIGGAILLILVLA